MSWGAPFLWAAGLGCLAFSAPARAAAEVFEPEIVGSAADFLPPDSDAFDQGLPDPDDPVGRAAAALMRRVYLGGASGPAAADGHPGALRVVSWNVADPGSGATLCVLLRGTDGAADAAVEHERAWLASADVLMLQEIRLSAALKLAACLGTNVVWAPEFLEAGSGDRAPAITGSATLSRFPLSDPRVIRFERQGDWYEEERRATPLPDLVKRAAGRRLFGADEPAHQVRPPAPYGGRLGLAVRVGGTRSITFVNLHLENRAKPGLRRRQMDEALAFIRGRREPVVFGGDLNTHGKDGRQLTAGRLLKGQVDTPGKVLGKAAGIAARLVPYGGWAKTGYDVVTWGKGKEDPTSRFNREHRLFDDVRKRLGARPLNERDRVGYKHTFAAPKPRQVLAGTLDWLFLHDPTGALSASRGRTFERLVAVAARDGAPLSDHFPVAVELFPRPADGSGAGR